MKNNRMKPALLILMLTFLSFPVLAQPPGQGPRRQWTEEDVKARVERLADTLQLSEKQRETLIAYELEHYKTMQKERENFDYETGDREAMRARMRELREKRDAKYAEVLTEEQLKKYQQIQEERRQQMRQRREEGSEGQRGRGRR
jgi:hypothetical protein